MLGTRETVLGFMAAAALAFGACEKQENAGPPAGTGGAGGQPATEEHADDHEHDAAAKHDLGSATIGAHTVQVAHYGEITPGEESDVDITVTGAAAPAAVRAWIGVEGGAGSIKARAESEGDHFHAHVEAPTPMPADAKLWVEIEGADGTTTAGSFALGG
jgi:hypothetical protein